MVGERQPLVPEIVGQTDPVRAKTPVLKWLFARSASAVTTSEKSSVITKHYALSNQLEMNSVRCP